MSLPDVVNGVFEGVGGLMLFADCLRLWWEKAIAGVNWQVRAFFLAWGVWNLFYYPHLDQWFSFGGGLLIVIANAIWVALAVHYSRKNRAPPVPELCPHDRDWDYCPECCH